jgi:hypothetical protein
MIGAMIGALVKVWQPLLPSAHLLLPQSAALAQHTHSRLCTGMKAVTFDKTGGLEVLQYTDIERPSPGQVCSSLSLALSCLRSSFRLFG